jgi:hypothetical protein
LPWQDLRAAFNERGWVDLTHSRRDLEVAGLTVEVSPKTAQMIRTVENKSGGIRVSLIPATSKDGGPSMKKLGLTGQAAKAALKRAKREIGGAMFAAMSNCVTSGKLGWRSTTLTKTGTFGVFFDQGDAEDTAALAEAEAVADGLRKELAELKAKLTPADKASLQAELAAA